jgi:hypothetical protein
MYPAGTAWPPQVSAALLLLLLLKQWVLKN